MLFILYCPETTEFRILVENLYDNEINPLFFNNNDIVISDFRKGERIVLNTKMRYDCIRTR